MKLKKPPVKEKFTTTKATMRDSTLERLDQYREFASIEADAPITRDELIDSMLTQFMDEDKTFARWIKKKENELSKTTAGNSAGDSADDELMPDAQPSPAASHAEAWQQRLTDRSDA